MRYPQLNEKEINWLKKFDQLILDNLSDIDLTNVSLATLLGMSDRKLYRIVNKLTGQSPNLYIRDIRLQTAYKMLDSGQFSSVKEVGRKIGFQKTAYFRRLFKAKFKTTPVEVLKKTVKIN